jgi:hypothetical protein
MVPAHDTHGLGHCGLRVGHNQRTAHYILSCMHFDFPLAAARWLPQLQ